MKQIIFLITAILFIAHPGKAQIYPDAAFHYGFIAAHKPSLNYLIRGDIKGVKIRFYKRYTGEKNWHYSYRYPYRGIGYSYMDLGNAEELGTAHALFGYFKSPWVDGRKFSAHYQFSAGLAFLNQGNIAIGTHLNAYVDFDADVAYKITDKHRIFFAFGATHYSNGAVQMPNLGLNLFTYRLGWRYNPTYKPAGKPNNPPDMDKKYIFSVMISTGIKEIKPPGGNKYWAYLLQTKLYRNLSFRRNLYIGHDIIYDNAMYTYAERNEEEFDNHRDALRMGLHLGHTAYVGNLGVLAELGILYKTPTTNQSPIFERLGLKYKFTDKFALQLAIRAHLEKADMPELSAEYFF